MPPKTKEKKRDIWFQLIGEDKKPFKGLSVAAIEFPVNSNVNTFKVAVRNSDAVKEDLTGISAARLDVYTKEVDVGNKEKKLSEGAKLEVLKNGEGMTCDMPLWILVPNIQVSSGYLSNEEGFFSITSKY